MRVYLSTDFSENSTLVISQNNNQLYILSIKIVERFCPLLELSEAFKLYSTFEVGPNYPFFKFDYQIIPH